jgi:hypothetical protein
MSSSLTVGRFDPAHLAAIADDAAEVGARPLLATVDPAALGPAKLARTVFHGERPVAAGGYVEMGHGVALAWGVVGDLPHGAGLALTRLVSRRIARSGYRWVEAHVTAGFDRSVRWMHSLGFAPVNGAACFGPDGREFLRFVFVGARGGH